MCEKEDIKIKPIFIGNAFGKVCGQTEWFSKRALKEPRVEDEHKGELCRMIVFHNLMTDFSFLRM